ncbi:integral membrane sensor signal transduction histidine kinase [Alkaliphilus metalliredigens QYMF]|uniref:histidine kinase n=1 Tax=Alkaliphilus metalliredigens (strain QYMF) TaxID=293826 RepID=A6TNE4_ALKMQ|nr:HAMP domain-containing sensor histidine kinase [Alkaliphilus metalliredigens]ABR47712.1 integral membrane sensor signal transduction histidine kinase [Alkaliphilus metalliredigens QYMF]
MKKQKITKAAAVILSGLTALIVSFVIAFFSILILSLIITSIMGYEISEEPTLSFKIFVLLAWIFILLMVKRYPRVRQLFGIEFMRQETIVRSAMVAIIVTTVLAGCFAIAHGLATFIYTMIGYQAIAAPDARYFWSLNWLLWLFILFLIKRFLWAKLPFGDEFMNKDKIVKGAAITITVMVIGIGCMAVAYLFASLIHSIVMGYRYSVPEEAPPYFNLFWFCIWILLLLMIKWYLKHRNIAKYIDLFAAVIRALESIAKGNFNVRLDDKFKKDESFSRLVKSVNMMASGLDQMEKMRQEFISNVSHEIQSPLASIQGFAQLLQNDELSPEERKHYLSIIETESKRLSKLSDSLLKLAILESDSMRFEPKAYRLDKQLRNLILACEPQWREKRINMEAFLDEVTITADEDMMSQVWINLIYNSIKFTPEGGSVRVDLNQHGKTIVCKISDTGIGIPEEDQKHIFERFYKADKSRERSKKGGGLGLSITKKIIDMHYGDISVQSKSGTGTTFTVSLPIQR